MATTAETSRPAPTPASGRLAVSPEHAPPVIELGIAALTAIVVGGIYLAANLSGNINLTPAVVLLALGVVALLSAVALTARSEVARSRRFWKVLRWVLLAYFISAGMLEYVFLYDGVRGGTLAVLTAMLVVFALDVPLLVAFTVARFTDTPE